jgi:hypothetical protein
LQPKFIEQGRVGDERTISEDFSLEDANGGWRLSVGKWIGWFGQNDENATLGDELELRRKTTLAFGSILKIAKRV